MSHRIKIADSRASARSFLVKRPTLGPFLIGLIFGGIPIGIAFRTLGSRIVSPNLLGCMLLFTPLGLLVATLVGIFSGITGWKKVMYRTFWASLGICLPIPTIVWSLVAWRYGYRIFTFDSLPYIVYILTIWALILTVSSWVLALLYVSLKDHFLRPTTTPPANT